MDDKLWSSSLKFNTVSILTSCSTHHSYSDGCLISGKCDLMSRVVHIQLMGHNWLQHYFGEDWESRKGMGKCSSLNCGSLGIISPPHNLKFIYIVAPILMRAMRAFTAFCHLRLMTNLFNFFFFNGNFFLLLISP